ncbi:transcriptional regulator [Pseudonocardia sulfidoxydans NBRC 16205]|uniref:Transcriptional regulator n=1 Tax=Pseudonocardia sulfidoxydans NBRC 16205 TaxID=1223511 RepID=A0A511DJ16_9PSEU|nr:helix-turn-helix domain-containing protein [Pseudonocardia sulfidoxydans]GEL23754.1 transcriptional regulator [Pseudonocardia sulfidoxydans NBRC 16205]
MKLSEVVRGLGPRVDFVTGTALLDSDVNGICAEGRPHRADQAVLVVQEPATGEAAVAELQQYCADAGITAVLMKDPARYSLAAPRTGTPTARATIVVIHEHVPWSDVFDCLSDFFGAAADSVALPDHGAAFGAITAAADELGAAMQGSVIIEDNNFDILAYSRATGDLDDARRVAILQRRLPETFQRAFNAQGVLAQLAGGQEILHVDAVPEIGLGPRLVAGVRFDGELLGSIWLARDAHPFTRRDDETLRAAAARLGPLVRRIQRTRDDQLEARNQSLLGLLRENAPAVAGVAFATIAGLPPQLPLHVLTFTAPSKPEPAIDSVAALRTAIETLGRSGSTRAFSVLADGALAVLLTGCPASHGQCGDAHPSRFASRVLTELGEPGRHVVAGVGGHRAALSSAWESARDSRRAAATLSAHRTGRRVASLREVWSHVALDECLPLLSAPLERFGDALDLLVESDASGRSEYVNTLAASLENWGETRRAADILHIHPNTLRYRLAQLTDLAGIDLDDPTQRLVLQLQLRLRRQMRTSSSSDGDRV